MKKKLLIKILIIIFAFIIVIVIYQYDNLTHLPEDNKKQLMSVLEIEDAPSFKPILKKKLLTTPMPGPSCVYEIKFEISVEDYEKNNLRYLDGESDRLDVHYKIKKNENTYLCTIRTSPQDEDTTKLYRAISDALK